jgi:hypothetical protein
MYDYASGNSGNKYTGTGQKGWVNVNFGGTVQTTCPTFQETTIAPYRLLYQLAQPVQETISTDGLYPVLQAGMNQVELAESVRIKESVTPSLAGSLYTINAHTNPNDRPKYLVERIIAVYRNGTLDPKWIISPNSPPDGTFGKYFAKINASDFDPTASYSVTYIAQPYAVSSSILGLDGSYESNLRKDVDKNTQNIADLGERLTAVELTKANRNQPNWIAPTLLNGWVNYGGTDAVVAYWKDDLGNVHIKGNIKSGTMSSVAFYLPIGYRPLETRVFDCVSYNGTSKVISQVNVYADGRVYIDTGGNTWFSLGEVIFRAEQ